MTDLTKLKELAERATPGPWSAVWEEGDDTAWPNLFPIIQADGGETVIGNEGFYSDLEQDKANAKFIAAANPQAILGLIERLDKAEHHWANENSNNMALIAEVERLRKDAERYRWLRSKEAECNVEIPMDDGRGWVLPGYLDELDAAIDAALEGGVR
ncbi:ead/Ea22-like family protein [Pseudomonas sp. NY15436]|uniref:ead/Ea22-like family protein n=1 Tax=Pseudomonas sp. NY15436 TaxID=3400359 RepID=UPI003A899C4D